MARVTIEGSITPSTFLRRGHRMTVERTDYIEKLIRGGYVVVVRNLPADTEVVEIPAAQMPASRGESEVRTDPPARNAKRSDWADFLESQDIEFGEFDTRDELIARWDAESVDFDG